jgi:hypothetical protein
MDQCNLHRKKGIQHALCTKMMTNNEQSSPLLKHLIAQTNSYQSVSITTRQLKNCTYSHLFKEENPSILTNLLGLSYFELQHEFLLL